MSRGPRSRRHSTAYAANIPTAKMTHCTVYDRLVSGSGGSGAGKAVIGSVAAGVSELITPYADVVRPSAHEPPPGAAASTACVLMDWTWPLGADFVGAGSSARSRATIVTSPEGGAGRSSGRSALVEDNGTVPRFTTSTTPSTGVPGASTTNGTSTWNTAAPSTGRLRSSTVRSDS